MSWRKSCDELAAWSPGMDPYTGVHPVVDPGVTASLDAVVNAGVVAKHLTQV